MSYTAYEFSTATKPSGRKKKSTYQLQLEEKRELLSLQIRRKWGVLPSDMFPADSGHRPRVWTLTILEELNALAGIASLEQVTGIFERVEGPITKELISGAIAECLRSEDVRAVSPFDKRPKSTVKKAEDVVFVATREETTPSPSARRSVPHSDSVAVESTPPAHETQQQFGLKRLSESSNSQSSELADISTPSTKRRKIQDQPPLSLEIPRNPTPPDSSSPSPHSSTRFELNVPFYFDEAPQFTEYITSLIQWGRQNLEEQHKQQTRKVTETTCRLASLRAEEARQNTALEKSKDEQAATTEQISKFEEILKSLLTIEEQQDLLASHAEDLEAKKREITRSNNLLVSSRGPSKTILRKSQKWAIELRYLKHRLALTTQDQEEMMARLQTAKSNIVTEARQLEADTEALRRAESEVKQYRSVKALSKVFADAMEKAGLLIDDAQ
ncbi:hypothetical protein F5Y03DRAFT_137309 [Xylaria venustula]|nr:hypothetical protein F5Y03DRAFT_137309 [Xylaria venustula]